MKMTNIFDALHRSDKDALLVEWVINWRSWPNEKKLLRLMSLKHVKNGNVPK